MEHAIIIESDGVFNVWVGSEIVHAPFITKGAAEKWCYLNGFEI